MALATLALGMVLLLGITQIGAGAGASYDRIGPRVFPYAVAAGLLLLGVALAVPAVRRAGATATPPVSKRESGPGFAPPVANLKIGPTALALALLLYLPLLEYAGFVIATSVQFWLVAFAFRSRHPARDAAVAVLVSVIVQVLFSRGLGVSLPEGILRGPL